jgi:hypothetical protein
MASTASKIRTDSKKGPFFGRFGRKTGVWGWSKNNIYYTFSRFSGFFRLQVVVRQSLPENSGPQKTHAEKPTVGFSFLGSCVKLAA